MEWMTLSAFCAGGRNGVNGIPSVDAAEGVPVKTSNFGRIWPLGRYTVNTTIKSGTNTYHGSLFEFLRNDDSTPTIHSNYAGVPIAKFRQNQFGGTIGGPVSISETITATTARFSSITGTESQADASLLDVVPASWRQGNFSSSSTQITTRVARPGIPSSHVRPFPATSSPEPDQSNRAEVSVLDTTGKREALIELPQLPGDFAEPDEPQAGRCARRPQAIQRQQPDDALSPCAAVNPARVLHLQPHEYALQHAQFRPQRHTCSAPSALMICWAQPGLPAIEALKLAEGRLLRTACNSAP
jgi:hypothetical protein